LGNARTVLALSERVAADLDSCEVGVLAWTARTLCLRARAQYDLREFKAAIATCDGIVQRFGSWDWPDYNVMVAEALLTSGLARARLGDRRYGIHDYQELIDRFGDSELPEIRTRIASALLNNGFAYMRRGDRVREIECYSELIERFDSVDGLRSPVAVALSFKCMAQAETGLADEALSGCHRLERALHSLSSDRKEAGEEPWATWLRWRALAARSLALAVRSESEASLQGFRAAYTAFPANNEVTIQEMLRLVVALVGAGAPPRDLLDVLTGETRKSDGLLPLIVSLHERAGNRVRAPREVEEVAADIGERFDEAAERIG
jgi:tetratricopeptide (TPR) repeat protein